MPAVDTDLHIVKREMYDADVMDILLRDRRFGKKDLGNLGRYKKGRLHANVVEVVYHYGKGCEKDQLGRLYPHNSQGLQSFPFDMRNPLLAKYYWDCDMENAHYSYLAKLTDDWGLKNENIKYYIANRNECLTALSTSRSTSKTAFLKVAYGGNIKLYSEFYNDDGITPDGNTDILLGIQAEMKFVVEYCWNSYKKYHKIVAKKPNPKFSLLSLILQTEERKCLQAMDAYLKTKNRQMDVYIHDGGEVLRLPNEAEFPVALLRGMEEAVFQATKHRVRIVVKPLSHQLVANPSQPDMCIINTDEDCCAELYKRWSSRIVRGLDGWYVNLPEKVSWDYGDNACKHLISKMNFMKPDPFGGYVPYSANISGLNNIFEFLKTSVELFPQNEEFINEINLATKGKVFYEDMYWDLSLKKFFKIEGSGLAPLIYIKRPAPTFYDAEDGELLFSDEEIATYKASCLNMFNDERDVGNYLHFMARAIGGHIEDKIFGIMKGERNSGKGILQALAVSAFLEYTAFIDIPVCKSYSGDASENRWLLTNRCNVKRLAFTNEAKSLIGKNGTKQEVPLDGNVLKKIIASGGDAVQSRLHYGGEVSVIPNITTMLSLNGLPTCDPPDALITMRLFNMPFSFVEATRVNEDISFRLADNNLKDKIAKNDRWRDIYTYLVFMAYTDSKLELSQMSLLNQEEQNEIVKSVSINPIDLLKRACDFSEDGWTSSNDLKRVLASAKMNHIKFGTFLAARGFTKLSKNFPKCVGSKEKKLVAGYTGLSLKKRDEDEAENENIEDENDDC